MEAHGVTADGVGPHEDVRAAWRLSSAVGSGRALAVTLALALHVGAVALLLVLGSQKHPPVERIISLVDLNLTLPPPAPVPPPKASPLSRPEKPVLPPERNPTPTHVLAPKLSQPRMPAPKPTPTPKSAPKPTSTPKPTPIEQAHRTGPSPTEAPKEAPSSALSSEPDYLPQYKITTVPALPIAEIRSRVRYPPLAARLGIEATVYLELYIDAHGVIRKIVVLKDPGHGFAAAAVAALEGLTVTPAEANGKPVAVRFRLPIRFTLK